MAALSQQSPRRLGRGHAAMDIRALIPSVKAYPAKMTSLMVRGQQTLVKLSLFNEGSFVTDALKVRLPQVSWLALASEPTIEKMSPNLYRKSHMDLERFARNRGMFVRFPKMAVGGLEPFSYIDFEARPEELHLHAFHAFPDQVTIIKTQSLVDFHS